MLLWFFGYVCVSCVLPENYREYPITEMKTLFGRLDKESSNLGSVSIKCNGILNEEGHAFLRQVYESSSLLIASFNDNIKHGHTLPITDTAQPPKPITNGGHHPTGRPVVRLNGELPIRCPKNEAHGWTYFMSCYSCQQKSYPCCGISGSYQSCERLSCTSILVELHLRFALPKNPTSSLTIICLCCNESSE
jgi:hypothetical protein